MGHVRRLPSNSITRKAPRWTPQGERTTKEMWWCTVEKDPNIRGMSLHMAQEQQQTEPDGSCSPLALKLHHQNGPQMDTSGREKEGTTKRDVAAHHRERPQYQGTEFPHGPRAAAEYRARLRTLVVASRARWRRGMSE